MVKLKIGDNVVLRAGKDKGKKGKVKKIFYKKQKVLVEGVNKVKKSMKVSQENPQGGHVQKDIPVHISNVALVSPKTGGPTRVRIEFKDKKKVRVAIKCGSQL